MKIFLKEADILISGANVTFDEYKKILLYDPKNASRDIEINQN